jgi:hypothetical protein
MSQINKLIVYKKSYVINKIHLYKKVNVEMQI